METSTMPERLKTTAKVKAKQSEPLPPVDTEGAIGTLVKMAEKPKVTPFQEVIQRAKEQIIAAFKQGYTRQDICDAMRDHGIKVTPRMLIEYVPEVRGGRTPKRMLTKRMTQAIDAANDSNDADLDGTDYEADSKFSGGMETTINGLTSLDDQPATEPAAKSPTKTPARTAAKSTNRPTTAKTSSKPTTRSTTSKPSTKGSTTKR